MHSHTITHHQITIFTTALHYSPKNPRLNPLLIQSYTRESPKPPRPNFKVYRQRVKNNSRLLYKGAAKQYQRPLEFRFYDARENANLYTAIVPINCLCTRVHDVYAMPRKRLHVDSNAMAFRVMKGIFDVFCWFEFLKWCFCWRLTFFL